MSNCVRLCYHRFSIVVALVDNEWIPHFWYLRHKNRIIFPSNRGTVNLQGMLSDIRLIDDCRFIFGDACFELRKVFYSIIWCDAEKFTEVKFSSLWKFRYVITGAGLLIFLVDSLRKSLRGRFTRILFSKLPNNNKSQSTTVHFSELQLGMDITAPWKKYPDELENP